MAPPSRVPPPAGGGDEEAPPVLTLRFKDLGKRRMDWKPGRRLTAWIRPNQAWFVIDKWNGRAFVKTDAGYCLKMKDVVAWEDYTPEDAASGSPRAASGFHIRTKDKKYDGWVFSGESPEDKAAWVAWGRRFAQHMSLQRGRATDLLFGGAYLPPPEAVRHEHVQSSTHGHNDWAYAGGDGTGGDDPRYFDGAVTDRDLGMIDSGWNSLDTPPSTGRIVVDIPRDAEPFEPQLADTKGGVRFDSDGRAYTYEQFVEFYGHVDGTLLWQHSLRGAPLSEDASSGAGGGSASGVHSEYGGFTGPPRLLPSLRPAAASRWVRGESLAEDDLYEPSRRGSEVTPGYG